MTRCDTVNCLGVPRNCWWLCVACRRTSVIGSRESRVVKRHMTRLSYSKIHYKYFFHTAYIFVRNCITPRSPSPPHPHHTPTSLVMRAPVNLLISDWRRMQVKVLCYFSDCRCEMKDLTCLMLTFLKLQFLKGEINYYFINASDRQGVRKYWQLVSVMKFRRFSVYLWSYHHGVLLMKNVVFYRPITVSKDNIYLRKNEATKAANK